MNISLLIKLHMRNRASLMRFIPEGSFYFGLIGGVGFIVDGGILTILSSWFGANVYAARAISFPIATVVTWYLNRTFTFKTHAKPNISKEEYVRYLVVQIGGALLNLAVFIILIQFFTWMNKLPITPLAVGAVFGMIFNYTFSRIWVFKAVQLNE
jgi:putative flippase GtrA